MTAVVIPVYNGAEVLPITVPAVLALDGVDEIVWVNDGSTDDTAALLSSLCADDPRCRTVALSRNRGRAAARNAGIAATQSDTLVFFDADSEPPPRAAQALADACRPPGVVASVARVDSVITHHGEPYQDYLAHFTRGPALSTRRGQEVGWRFFITCACAVRRDALERAGGFQETVGYGEDLALACALASSPGARLVLADTTVRLHDIGQLGDAVASARAFGRSLSEIGDACAGWLLRAARAPVLGQLAAPVGWGLRWGIARLGPGPLRRRAVRYLLAMTILSAARDA